MRSHCQKIALYGYLTTALFYIIPLGVSALEISRFSDVPVKNDIVLSPAKVEISLDAGVQSVQYLNILNRMGQDAVFGVEVEDFAASEDPSEVVALDKTVSGLESSLKKYITIDRSQFTLSHGEEARIPVTISLPKKIPSGGLYAAVLISGAPLKNASGSARVVTRLGSMFFVKVNGSVKQSGLFMDASFSSGQFKVFFKNDGDIYLDPYGIIDIYDRSQNLVHTIKLDPWFVMPRSIRLRAVELKDLSAGSYTAKISVNRGYDNIVDVKDLDFTVGSAYSGILRFWLLLPAICLILFLYKYFFYAKRF